MARIEIHHAPTAPTMTDVRVNGEPISRREIAAEVANFPAATPAESWRAATQALALRAALRQRAKKFGVVAAQEADDAGRLETEEDALLRGLLAIEVRPPAIGQADIDAFYAENRERMKQPLAEAVPRIAAYLADRALHRTVAAYLARVMTEAVVEHLPETADTDDETKLRRFLNHADDEAWLTLIGAMNRAADPGQAAMAAILAKENAS